MINGKKYSIWVLEDNEGCLFVYEEILSEKYDTKFFVNLAQLFESAKSGAAPDLLITDIALPDGKFLNHLDDYRQIHPHTPIIIVSGMDDYETISSSFSEGVIDYLTKPFRPTELLVKVERALVAKIPAKKGLGIEGKDVVIDGIVMENLTAKQIQILSLFIQSKQRRVSKETLIKSVWGNTIVHPKALDVHIYHLRRRLEEYGFQIKSIGQGEWQLLSRFVNEAQK
jgi:DNA-binding response OmpR family regulator